MALWDYDYIETRLSYDVHTQKSTVKADLNSTIALYTIYILLYSVQFKVICAAFKYSAPLIMED